MVIENSLTPKVMDSKGNSIICPDIGTDTSLRFTRQAANIYSGWVSSSNMATQQTSQVKTKTPHHSLQPLYQIQSNS